MHSIWGCRAKHRRVNFSSGVGVPRYHGIYPGKSFLVFFYQVSCWVGFIGCGNDECTLSRWDRVKTSLSNQPRVYWPSHCFFLIYVSACKNNVNRNN